MSFGGLPDRENRWDRGWQTLLNAHNDETTRIDGSNSCKYPVPAKSPNPDFAGVEAPSGLQEKYKFWNFTLF